MINVKKTLTKIFTSLVTVSDYIETSSFTVPAGGTYEVTIDVSKTNYRPIGITSILKSGGGNGDCVLCSYFFTGNNLKIAFRNVSTLARTIAINVRVIYLGGVIRTLKNAISNLYREGVAVC